MAEMGLFGLPFPEEYGGMGGDYFALCLALEELGKIDQSVAITLEAGVSLGAMPVYRFGTEAQKQHWLPAPDQRRRTGGIRAHRSGRGTDAGATRTTARLDDGHWVINGSKQFITNSGTGSPGWLPSPPSPAWWGAPWISSIMIPVPTAGFTVEPSYDKVGWNASDTHPLSFSDVRVPEENLLGERGRGYANFLRILDGAASRSRHWRPAPHGAAWTMRRYSSERTAFGNPISRYQAIEFKIARMEARAHAAAPPTTTPRR